MASAIEEDIICLLRTALAPLPVGSVILESEYFRAALCCLESYLVALLRGINAEWKHESLDGILPLTSRKTGEQEVEIVGHCILITDQSLTPIHLRLQISSTDDEISYLECRLGERGEAGMKRTPYTSSFPASKRLLAGDIDNVDWFYKVGFGQSDGKPLL
jgi:hypothetical protein